MAKKELKIVFIPIEEPTEVYQKRVDEISQILYELYCQHRLKESVHNQLNHKNPVEEKTIQ